MEDEIVNVEVVAKSTGLDKLNKDLSNVQKNLHKVAKTAGNGVGVDRTEVIANAKALREFNDRLNDQSKYLRGSAKNVQHLRSNLRNLKKQLDDVSKSGIATGKSIKGLDKGQLGGFKRQLSSGEKYRVLLHKMREDIRSITTAHISMAKNTQWTGRQMMVGVSMPLALAANEAVHAYTSVSSEVTRLIKVGETSSGQALGRGDAIVKDLQKSLRSLSSEYAVQESLVTGIAADWAAMGVPVEELAGSVDQILKVAALGDVDMSQASEFFRSLKATFAEGDFDVAANLVDQLNQIENATSLGLADMAEGMPEVASVMKNLNIDAAQTASILAAMHDAGLEATESAHALKFGLQKLANPTAEAAEILRIMDVNLFNANGSSREGIEVLTELAHKMKGVTDESKMNALSAFFDNRQSARLQVFLEDLTKTEEAGGVYAKAMAAAADSAGKSSKELETMFQAPEHKLKQFRVKLTQALTDIGAIIVPPIIKIGNVIIKVIDKILALPGPIKSAIGAFLAFITVIGPVVYLFGQLHLISAVVIKGLGSLIPKMDGVTAASIKQNGVYKGLVVQIGNYFLGIKSASTETTLATTAADKMTVSMNAQAAAVAKASAAHAMYAANAVDTSGLYGYTRSKQAGIKPDEALKLFDVMTPGKGLKPKTPSEAEMQAMMRFMMPAADPDRIKRWNVSAPRFAIEQWAQRVRDSVTLKGGNPRTGLMSKILGIGAGAGTAIMTPITGIIGGLGRAFKGIGKAATGGGVSGISDKIKRIGEAFGHFATKLKNIPTIAKNVFTAISKFGKFTVVTAVIGAVVYAVTELVKKIRANWDVFMEHMQPAIDSLKHAFNRIKLAVQDVMDSFSRGFGQKATQGPKEAADEVASIGDKIAWVATGVAIAMEWIANAINFVAPVFSWLGERVRAAVEFIGSLMKGDLIDAMTAALAFVWPVARSILNVIEMIPEGLADAIGFLLGGLSDLSGLLSHIPGADDLFGGWSDSLEEFSENFHGYQSELVSRGDQIVDNFYAGFRHGSDDTGDDIAEDIIEPLEVKFPEAGEQAGEDLGDGLKKGLDKSDWFGDFLSAVKTSLDERIEEIKEMAIQAMADAHEKELAAYDKKVEAIEALEEKEKDLYETQQYYEQRRKMLADRALQRNNYQKERALAIYEGRIDDARMLDLEERKNTQDFTSTLKNLDDDRARKLLDKQRQMEKDRLKIQKDAAAARLKAEEEAFKKQLDIITEYSPRTVAEFQEMLDAITAQLKITGLETWPGIQLDSMNEWTRIFVDANEDIRRNADWQGENSALTWMRAFVDADVAAILAGAKAGPSDGDLTINAGGGAPAGSGVPGVTIIGADGKPWTYVGGNNADEGGGWVPAYHSGGEVQGEGEVPARLLSGEFVLNREAVKNIGLPSLNAMNRKMKPHTGDGLGEGISRTGINNMARASQGFITGQSKIGKVGRGPALTATLRKIPAKMWEPFIGPQMPAGGFGSIEAFGQWIASLVPGAVMTSAYRPGAITADGNLSQHAVKKAVDIGGPPDVLQKIFETAFGLKDKIGLHQLIYKHNQWRDTEGWLPFTRNDHMTHVHIGLQRSIEELDAIIAGQKVGIKDHSKMKYGGIVPYDGFTASLHKGETVFPKAMTDAIMAGGGGTTIYVENFIGEEEWFNQMMQKHDMKVVKKKARTRGEHKRTVSSYNGGRR